MGRRAMAVLSAAVAVLSLAFAAAPQVGAATSASGEGDYIVVLRDSVPSARSVADEHRRDHRAEVSEVYEHALKGYAARLGGRELGAVRSDPRVAYVEADGVASKSAVASWGLDRIDDRAGLDGSYGGTSDGSGVTAYVIDTGIDLDHREFAGRVRSGIDTVDDDADADDCDGHGTHVAGTIGGATYGVAPRVSLVAVRVLDCSGSGTWGGVIAGIDWVAAQAIVPAVANLSLGGGASSAVDDAVRGLIGKRVATVVAAGNGNQGGKAQDACNYSPARVTEALTIGATDKTDTKTSWSNYGACVDFFAPGYQITSAKIGGGSAVMSGTSMAAPHVAGAAALYLQRAPSAMPASTADALATASTKWVVESSKTATNHLLYTCPDGFGATNCADDTPPPDAPTKPRGRK